MYSIDKEGKLAANKIKVKFRNEIIYYRVESFLNSKGMMSTGSSHASLWKETLSTAVLIKVYVFFIHFNLGIVVVFDLLNGAFIKQIPYQAKMFKSYYLREDILQVPEVEKLEINTSD